MLNALSLHPCHVLSEYNFCKVIFALCDAVAEPPVGKTAMPSVRNWPVSPGIRTTEGLLYVLCKGQISICVLGK
jgi:hypothetical protein